MTAPGWVKSITASHPVSASRSSPRSTSAATCRSGASLTARITSRPIRPRAPTTPTSIIVAAGSGLEGGGVVERADHGQRLGAGGDLGGHGAGGGGGGGRRRRRTARPRPAPGGG